MTVRKSRGRHLGVDAGIFSMLAAFNGETIIVKGRACKIVRTAHDGYVAGVTHLDLVRLKKETVKLQESDPQAVGQVPHSVRGRVVPRSLQTALF